MTVICLFSLFWSINRNILECKVSRVRLIVLIETYWNVKLGTTAAMSLTSDSINRNILECKGTLYPWLAHFVIVLIETYWNVKEDVQLFLKRLRKY